MKRFVLIYNPLSGNASFKNELDTLIGAFQRRNCLLIPLRTESKHDTGRFISLAQELCADGIIAAGGDGTIHEVVNALLAANVNMPLGLIPCGTSNDFASYLSISRDLEACADMICCRPPQFVDVGKINDKYFMNVACGGMLPTMLQSTDTTLKNTLGKVAYYLKTVEALSNLRSFSARIKVDDTVIEDDIFLFLVLNSGIAGGFVNLAPCASLTDGKLDVLIVSKCNIPEFMRLLLNLFTGNHTSHKNITYLQASQVEIACNEHLFSDVDGEVGPPLPLSLSAVSDRLQVFIP